MGCNLSFLKKNAGSNPDGKQKRILMLGLDNAGKTSILFNLKQGEYVQTVPTVGLNVEHISYRNLSLTLWDVGGQARTLWKHYFQNTSALIFVVDATDRERIALAKEQFHRTVYDQQLGKCPILLFLNKSDIENKMTREQLFSELELQSLFLSNFRIIVQESSAKSKYGLWEGIAQLAGYIDTSDPSISSGRDEKKEDCSSTKGNAEEQKQKANFKNEHNGGLVDKSGSTADTAPEQQNRDALVGANQNQQASTALQ